MTAPNLTRLSAKYWQILSLQFGVSLLAACGGGGGGGGNEPAPAVTPTAYTAELRISGQGFVVGSFSGTLSHTGARLTVNDQFLDKLLPIPVPGHSFDSWSNLCSPVQQSGCELPGQAPATTPAQFEARFAPDYEGPLELIDYFYYPSDLTRILDIPVDSIVIAGTSASWEAVQAFLAPPGMDHIVQGRLENDTYTFDLPDNDYAVDDYWLFITAKDHQGILASASINIGNADFLGEYPFSPVNPDSEFSDVIASCISANNVHTLCSIKTLPYIGSRIKSPTIDDILDHTVVSHAWMGTRFREVLEALPEDLLKMFRGATAVVIGAEIRPSFFSPLTAAIHLDPQDLWLIPSERETINWDADYRSEFGSVFQFYAVSDYLDGSDWAWLFSDDFLEGESRALSDISSSMTHLLIHELAHANDAMPPSRLPDSDNGLTPLDFFYRFYQTSPSETLANTYPLGSRTLLQLGQVLYQGAEATDSQLALTAGEVGDEFETDSANGMYSYSSIEEDTATLVEEVLLKHYLDIDRLVAFMDEPVDVDADCTEFILQWSSVNRASVPSIAERARLVLGEILDESDVSKYLDSVPEQTSLISGISLCENVDLLQEQRFVNPGIFRNLDRLRSQQRKQLRHVQTRKVVHDAATRNKKALSLQ